MYMSENIYTRIMSKNVMDYFLLVFYLLGKFVIKMELLN